MKERCMLCGSEGGRQVWGANIAHLPGVKGNLANEKVWLQCDQCSFVFSVPRPTPEQLSGFYHDLYANEEVGLKVRTDRQKAFRLMQEYYKYFEHIRELNTESNGKALLDIGCGPGFFSAVAKHLGWRSIGIELASEAAQYARTTFNLDVLEKDIETLEFNTEFDLIAMLELFEHLLGPLEVLRKVASRIKENGVLVLSTPDVEHPYHIMLKGNDPMWSQPGHITYWSRSHLTRVLNDAGLTVTRIESSGLYLGCMVVYAQKK